MSFSDSVTPPKQICSPGLVRLLTRLQLVSPTEIEVASKSARNSKLLASLVEQGNFSEASILERLSRDLGLRLVIPLQPEVGDIDRIRSTFDSELALGYRCFPLQLKQNEILLAACDPLDLEMIKDIEYRTQCSVRLVLSSEREIVAAISKFLVAKDRDLEKLQEVDDADLDDSAVEIVSSTSKQEKGGTSGLDAAPIVRLVNKILLDATAAEASDIHLVPSALHLEVKFRVDGVLKRQFAVAKRSQPFVVNRIKLIAGMNITERRRPQDGRFRIKLHKGVSRDIRASAVPTPAGESIVLRLLGAKSENGDLESLGMSAALKARFAECVSGAEQLIAVTGPTGSGKTTTLYSALQILQQNNKRIVTVEDPVEFRVEGVTQIQVDQKLGVTFASGLRSILRQDPDAILVGEIRDRETAEIALQAGQTGHLVLTTLHTNDAVGAITRLRDLGLPPYVIASSMKAVLAQRLVRQICEACKRPLTETEAKSVPLDIIRKRKQLCKGNGCPECENTGYHGRKALFSFLMLTPEIREAIRTGEGEETIRELGYKSGLVDLGDAGIELVENGVTTFEEIERVLGGDWSSGRRSAKAVESPHPSSEPKQKVSFASLAKDYTQRHREGRRRVLLVDDDEGVRAVLSRLLVGAGYEVHETGDGDEALRISEELEIDVMVCDLVMPKMGGEEIVAEMRARQETKAVPILMLTGSDDEDNEIRMIEVGATDFVSKTASPQLVLARIKRLLDR